MRFLLEPLLLLLLTARLNGQVWSWTAPDPPLPFTQYVDYGWDSTSNYAVSSARPPLGLPLSMSTWLQPDRQRAAFNEQRRSRDVPEPPFTALLAQSTGGTKVPTYIPKADTSWSNNAGTVYPGTNRVAVGAAAIPNAAQFYVVGVSYDYTGVHHIEAYASGAGDAAGLLVWARGSNYTGRFSAAAQFRNDVVNTDGDAASIWGGVASYGLDVLSTADNGGVQRKGAMVAVQGYSTGENSVHNGVSGIAFATKPNSTNVGTAGSAIKSQFLTGVQSVGLMGEVGNTGDSVTPSRIEDAVLLLDNWTTGVPLIKGRTNNGVQVFRVDNDGTVTASAVRFGNSNNRFIINVSNPQVGQALRIHSVTSSGGGINSIVLTNSP